MRIFSSLVLAAGLIAPAAFAQTPAPTPPPAAAPLCGTDAVRLAIRVSDIKPGTMDTFLSAIKAHQAWYKSHGYPDDVIVYGKLIVRDPSSNAMVFSDSEVLTYHFFGPMTQAQPVHDAAWDAYVKLYSDSSTIKETYLTCVPKSAVPPH
jgi:hypothetical protein